MAAIRPAADPVRLLADAVAESHRQLRRGVADDPARAGMATTLTALLARHDRLTAEDVRSHPYRSVVLKSVNADQLHEPAVWSLDVAPGDRLLVCSDGLSDLVDETQIEALLLAPDPDEAAAALVESALAEGGRDNVTCLVADLVDGPRVCPDGRHLGAMRDPDLVVDPAAVRPGRIA